MLGWVFRSDLSSRSISETMGGRTSGAGVALLLSYLAYHYHRSGLPDWYHEARLPEPISAIQVHDTDLLKRVLFSGEPWLLQCYSGLPYEGQHLPRPYRVHPVFKESLGPLRGLVRTGTLDCEAKLPSNKSLIEKFGLTRQTQPLLLFASGGRKPKQLAGTQVASAYSVTAWVKPRAQPTVRHVTTQKQLHEWCAGRRACVLTRMAKESPVLEQLAAKHRTLEVVTFGETEAAQVSVTWGRGEEVGETLEEGEARHFGASVSLLLRDPDAVPPRKGAPAPRLLRGFGGEQDFPSLDRFVSRALAATDDDFVRTPLPTVAAVAKKKKTPSARAGSGEAGISDRDRQSIRAAKLREKRARELKEAEEKARERAAEQLSPAEAERLRQQRELLRREQMAEEQAAADNIIEEVDDGDDESEDDDQAADDDTDDDDDTDEDALDLDM